MAIIEGTHQNRWTLSSSPIATVLAQISGITVIWAAWETRRRYRTELKRLFRVGPHMIDDIGLTLEEVYQETAKPRWQV